MKRFWSRDRPVRESGSPPSGNGASSMHLWWDVPAGDRYSAASVTVEIAERPPLERLVFFALQVSFVEPGGGGAHLGLQHNPRFPFASAANWGGYDPHGELLQGTESPLPSTHDDANTRDFPWLAETPYQLSIVRGEERGDGWYAWEGMVTDLWSGEETLVRRLWSPGRFLRVPVVWTENFASCDAPRFRVRWSNAAVVTDGGEIRPISTMRTDYQAYTAGGCTNTNTVVDGTSFVQTTTTERTTKPGVSLSIA